MKHTVHRQRAVIPRKRPDGAYVTMSVRKQMDRLARQPLHACSSRRWDKSRLPIVDILFGLVGAIMRKNYYEEF